MGEVLDDITVELTCPECGAQIPRTIAWIKTNDEHVCEECGETVPVAKRDLMRDVKKIEDALREMGLRGIG